MNTPLISVIVPVYKVEQYLPKCIDSILAQTYTNFELLLIDDGSPDNSGKICDDYAVKDSRIKVFHKENGGVSSARNLGLDNANGKWVCFVDSDDWVSEDYLYIPEQFHDVDVVQKSYFVYYDENKERKRKLINCNHILDDFDSIVKFYVNHRENALWDKIISKRIISERRLDTKISIGEDFLFFFSLLSSVKTYGFCNVGSYSYILRNGSAIQEVNRLEGTRIKILFKNIENVKKTYSDYKMHDVQMGIIYQSYFNALFSYRKSLSVQQKTGLTFLINNLMFSNLRYLTFCNIVKLYCKIFIYYCGL